MFSLYECINRRYSVHLVCYNSYSNFIMEDTIEQVSAPATTSGRLLKTEGRQRSFSEERIRFIEEEYDVRDYGFSVNDSFSVTNWLLGFLLCLEKKSLLI